MKKYFMFLTCSFFVLAASAQVKVGLRGGLSFANAKYTAGTNSETFNSISTPNVGLTLDFPTSKSFVIQSGLLYSGMGGKLTTGSNSYTVALNYLSIPVLAKANFGTGFYGYAGPQLSILLSAKGKYSGGSEDLKNEIKGSGIFGVFGLGYSVSDKFNFFSEYSAGLSNLSKISTNGDKWNANAFTIGVGLGLTK